MGSQFLSLDSAFSVAFAFFTMSLSVSMLPSMASRVTFLTKMQSSSWNLAR